MNKITTSLFFASIIGLSACSQESTESASVTTTSPASASKTEKVSALPENFFLTESPAHAVTLSEARASAKTGEGIAFTGYVGGRVDPFVKDRALFLVADSDKAPACGDECETPWDACCVPGEDIAANSASIQVVDMDGKILPLDIAGQNGLVAGSLVTVVGKVREANDGMLIIDATGVAVKNNTE